MVLPVLIRSLRAVLFGLFIVFSIGSSVQAQNAMATDAAPQIEYNSTNISPVAIPVLNEVDAQKANEEALISYSTQIERIRKERIHKIVGKCLWVLVGIILGCYMFVLHKKKILRKTLFKAYQSPVGRMFYCTRFCRWDWLGMLIVFVMVFFFSLLAGENAARKGYFGDWYAHYAGPVALSIYNTGKPARAYATRDSKLDHFLREGCNGNSEYSSITDEEAIPQRYDDNASFLESTGIAWMIAYWWKLIGHPDWSTLYILFSLFYGITAVAAYCALRQATGLIPSVFLGLLLSSYPSMMHQGIFGFRDGARALFCYIAIAILLYLLKGWFKWKGTIVCSVFLFLICSLSTYFRQDFIVLIPFILIATIIFHGKILANYKKKTAIILSIVIGLIISFNLPGTATRDAMGHVLYIGMADTFIDQLHFSSDNYSHCIAYSDYYGFIIGAAKAYRDRGELNVSDYSKAYDKEMRKEIYGLFQMFPYDFFRLALSSLIQNMNIGSRFSKRQLKWIESAPGYQFFQKKTKNFYDDLPSWLSFVFLAGTLILFLGGKFYRNMFLCLSLMVISGIYMLQYDIRHYFFLMIISLLTTGFVFNRVIRFIFILSYNWKRIGNICTSKRKVLLQHCLVFVAVFAVALSVLYVSKIIQGKQTSLQIDSLAKAKTENIVFTLNTAPSKLQRNTSATEVLFPKMYKDTLDRENSKQMTFTEYLKIKFKINDFDINKNISIFALFENTPDFISYDSARRPNKMILSTGTCPIPVYFNSKSDSGTIYIPIYFLRKNPYSSTTAPLLGVEILAGGKTIDVESVERITETDVIRTQSAFLVPEQPLKMQYAGVIDWDKVFWGDKK